MKDLKIETIESIIGKKILVCGMARSGISAAVLLKRFGADVTVSDLKDRDKIENESDFLENNGVKIYVGKNPDDIVTGFDLIVISPGIPYDLPFLKKARQSGIEVWGEIELAYRLCDSKIIAVTGTNGKTTTTALTGEIFMSYNNNTHVVGNIGVPFCDKVETASKSGFVIAEISSFQMETAETFKPWISAVLNVTPDHLNRHKSMDNYIHMKEKIFENQDDKDFTVLNYDDEICRSMAEKTSGTVIFFSRLHELCEGVFLKGEEIYIKWCGYDMPLINKNELMIFGSHNIENVMAAAAMSLAAGIGPNIIREGLVNFQGVPHRIEFVRTLNRVDYYNDSKATNSDASIKALESFDNPIILIVGGRDKMGDFSDLVMSFGSKVKYVIAIGEAADLIIETCKTYNFMNFLKANSMKDAVDISASMAQKGDCVLLSPACASFDMFDSYEQRGDVFKEFVHSLASNDES